MMCEAENAKRFAMVYMAGALTPNVLPDMRGAHIRAYGVDCHRTKQNG